MDDGEKSKLSKDKPTQISLRSAKIGKRKQINRYAVMEFQNENLKIRNRRLIRQFTTRYKRLEQTNRNIVGQIVKLYGERTALQKEGQNANAYSQQLQNRISEDQTKIKQIASLNQQANFRILELENLAKYKEADLGMAISGIQNKEIQLINMGQKLQKVQQQKQYSQMQLQKKDFEIKRLAEVEQSLHRQILQAQQQLGTAIEQKSQLNSLIQQLKRDATAAYIQMQGKVANLEEQRDRLTQAKQKIYDQTVRLNMQISRIAQENQINSKNFHEEKERLFNAKEKQIQNIRNAYQQMINNYKASQHHKISQISALINEMYLLKQVIVNQSVQIASVRNELANNIWAHKSSKQVADYTQKKGRQQRSMLQKEIELLKQQKQEGIRYIRIQKDQHQELIRQAQLLRAKVQFLQEQKNSSQIAARSLADKITMLERQRTLQVQTQKYIQDDLLNMNKRIASSEQRMSDLEANLKESQQRQRQLLTIIKEQQTNQAQNSKQVQIYRQEVIQKAKKINFLQSEIKKQVEAKIEMQQSVAVMKREIKALIKQQESSRVQIGVLIERLKQKQKLANDFQKKVLSLQDNQIHLLQTIGAKGKELYDMQVNEQKQKNHILNLEKQLIFLKDQDSMNRTKRAKDLLQLEKSLVEIQNLKKQLSEQQQRANKSEETTLLLERQLRAQSQKAHQDRQKSHQIVTLKQKQVANLKMQLQNLQHSANIEKQGLQTRMQIKNKQLTKALKELQQQKHNTTFYDNKYKQMIQKHNSVVRLLKDLQVKSDKQRSTFDLSNKQSNQQITSLREQINAHDLLVKSLSKDNLDIKSAYELSLKGEIAKNRQINTQLLAYRDKIGQLQAKKTQLQGKLASLYRVQALQRLDDKQKQKQSLNQIEKLRKSIKQAQLQHDDKIGALHALLDREAAKGSALVAQIKELSQIVQSDKQEIISLKQAAQKQRNYYLAKIGQIQNDYSQRIIELQLRLLNQVFLQKLNRQQMHIMTEPAQPSYTHDTISNAVIYGSTFIQSNIDDKGLIWIGTKITKGNQRFYTRNSVKATKQDIKRIIQTYNGIKSTPVNQKIIKMINPKLGLIRDIYKGQEYYSIRQFNYYRNKAQPTRNGFNLKPPEMEELTH